MTTTISSVNNGHYCPTEQYVIEMEDGKNGKITDVNLATAQTETECIGMI